MTILDILILKLGFSQSGEDVMGDVQFMIDMPGHGSRNMTLTCRCPNAPRIPPDAALIGDAIRQLRRMPEIRSSAASLAFAPGLKPLQTARAA